MRNKKNIRLSLSEEDEKILNTMSDSAFHYFGKMAPRRQRQMLETAKKRVAKEKLKSKQIRKQKQSDLIGKQNKVAPSDTGTGNRKGSMTSHTSDTDAYKAGNQPFDYYNHAQIKQNENLPYASYRTTNVVSVKKTAQSMEKLVRQQNLDEQKKTREKNDYISQERQKSDMMKQGFKGGAGLKATVSGIKTAIKSATASGIAAVLPYVIAALAIALLILSVVLAIPLMLGAINGTEEEVGRANVSEKVEAYRDTVSEYCEQYGISEFTDVVLCIMMQESGGNEPDPMQAAEGAYGLFCLQTGNKNGGHQSAPNGIPTGHAECSINAGVQEFRNCLANAGCKSVSDKDTLYVALQGYNFGQGYISWVKANYDGKYSPDNAATYSAMMAAKMGWSNYGDKEYVNHVMRYYISVGKVDISDVSNEDTKKVLKMIQDNNDIDGDRWSVICMGATRIGCTKYDMYGDDTRSGSDNPKTLDCSSFTAWSFHKAGYTDIPFTYTTDSFLTSKRFKKISASELEPGDIGLIIGQTGFTGGSNHVGIYVGKDKKGNRLWMHCTSGASGSGSLTKVSDGPRISYYSSFTVFYRYKGFQSQ